MARWWAIFTLLFLLQGAYWWHTLSHKPYMEIVPSVPSPVAVKALSFGDSQAFFRYLGHTLQNFGDTYGRFTPLKEYDFDRLNRWLVLLDTLDNRSNYMPSLASYYFSQTQNTQDVRYIVDYLIKHSEGRLDKKWWWRAQAVYLANHKLHDTELALKAALPLMHATNVPVWVNQLPAFIYEKRGEFDDALAIMEHVQKNGKNLSAGELNFIRHFITERLGALKHAQETGQTDQPAQQAAP